MFLIKNAKLISKTIVMLVLYGFNLVLIFYIIYQYIIIYLFNWQKKKYKYSKIFSNFRKFRNKNYILFITFFFLLNIENKYIEKKKKVYYYFFIIVIRYIIALFI